MVQVVCERKSMQSTDEVVSEVVKEIYGDRAEYTELLFGADESLAYGRVDFPDMLGIYFKYTIEGEKLIFEFNHEQCNNEYNQLLFKYGW